MNDPKEAICYYCQEKGHWKRTFPMYLEDLKEKKPKVLALHVCLQMNYISLILLTNRYMTQDTEPT